MYCEICEKHIAECQCPDIQERLDRLKGDPRTALVAHQNEAMRRDYKQTKSEREN